MIKEVMGIKSISFPVRQLEFFRKHPDFKAAVFCRMAIDEQIALIDPSFLPEVNNEEAINGR